MRRLNFEELEQRDMAAVAEFRANLLADCRGVPGPAIASVHGSTFWLEVTAQDMRPNPLGVYGASIDVISPFAVHEANLTDKLPLFANLGTVDPGYVNDLTGATGFGVGSPIGQHGPERFALLRMEANESGEVRLRGGMYGFAFSPALWTTSEDFVFGSLSVEVEPHREYGPDFIGPIPADVYFGMPQECFP